MLYKKSFKKMPEVVQKIINDFSDLNFYIGNKFMFRPPNNIFLDKKIVDNYALLLLHEIGHALSKHRDYKTYFKLLDMETEAWEKAEILASKYGVFYDENLVQEHLDTYRDFLYTKTTCLYCGNYCLEGKNGKLFCPFCENFMISKK